MEGACIEQRCNCCYYSTCYDHNDPKAMMWHLMKKAKMELLKEKIKEMLDASDGKKMDEIAQILVDGKMELKKKKSEIYKKKEEMMEQLWAVFGEEK
jgi:hypothetical protein